ncbi:MAG TPA: T9SS type A sorting domain-containing protein [Bacteroidota bacterium]
MKRGFRFLIFGVCTIALVAMSYAQTPTVTVKREAMSPGRRSSGAPNYTAPAGPWYVSTGLRVVPKGMKVYFSADTSGSGASAVTSVVWSLTARAFGSNSVLDSTNKMFTSFTPDVAGEYIISVSVNGGAKTSSDTIFASTYLGNPKASGVSCSTCHAAQNTAWAATAHATIFKRGVTGGLEVNTYGKGAYASACVKCHTTGWESATNNGNFGYLAKTVGWDTTWYKSYPFADGDYWIPNGDMTLWNGLNPTMAAVATIGCESCHGPGTDHLLNQKKIGVSYDGGVCNQCHDAPKKHRLGSYWAASNHATMKLSASESNRAQCFPCHNGQSFAAYASNKTAPNYSKVDLNFKSIACVTCHDPHSIENPNQLRTVRLDSLVNGYKIAADVGGKGQLCMNCHRARNNSLTQVNNQKNRFADRFYPHYSPQADMFLGANAYEFGLSFAGLNTHAGLKDGCVTCHMSERVNGSSVHPDHEMSMEENGADKVEACRECHGNITHFTDIKAMTDYDNDGSVESAVAEVQGLLDQLKAILPKDATGEPVTMAKDSIVVKNHPNYPKVLGPLFNYHYVTHDMSKGIHNTKYTVALLRTSLSTLTGVELDPLPLPATFELSQNYPNPFNPTTRISFIVPKQSHVTLHVYDMMGRVVTTLMDEVLPPGKHAATWNGRTTDGRLTASGIYFYALKSEGYVATRKMLLLK